MIFLKAYRHCPPGDAGRLRNINHYRQAILGDHLNYEGNRNKLRGFKVETNLLITPVFLVLVFRGPEAKRLKFQGRRVVPRSILPGLLTCFFHCPEKSPYKSSGYLEFTLPKF